MNTKLATGAANELRAAAYYTEQGWEVFWSPAAQGAADFLMQREGEVRAVQVKTAHVMERSGRTETRLYLKRSNGTRYLTSDFDILAVVCSTGRMWSIPFNNLPSVTTITLHSPDGEGNNRHDYDKYMVNNYVH